MAVSVSIVDVAAYILSRESTMVTMKLHKLAFYAQAEHLVRHTSPLFPEDFHAWIVGPVCPQLYSLHRGKLLIRPGELPSGDPSDLTDAERALIDRICAAMGSMTHAALSKRMYRELPWADAYARHTSSSLSHLVHLPIVTTDEIITQEEMLAYYSEHRLVS
jgi:uncharacterized phage-associated protein